MTYEERLALAAIGRAEANDRDELITALVREHSTFVYRLAYSILRETHDAEDVVQETFIRVVKNFRRLPLIRDQRAWLGRIAWRLALTKWNRVRKKRSREIEAVDANRMQIISPTPTDSDEMVAVIERMTASLPDHLRHALILSAIDEMSAREVGAVLNISEATVRTRVHRARKLLREKLRSVLGKDYAG